MRRKNLFISHHHADDETVTRLTDMLARSGYAIRNSSIRAKPANERRLKEGLVKPETIKRLLRRKISWASVVLVLVGKHTHTRQWVDWEIQTSHRLGKRIVGVYERGGTEAHVPDKLVLYRCAMVNWNAKSLIAAIEGLESPFETPSGEPLTPQSHLPPVSC